MSFASIMPGKIYHGESNGKAKVQPLEQEKHETQNVDSDQEEDLDQGEESEKVAHDVSSELGSLRDHQHDTSHYPDNGSVSVEEESNVRRETQNSTLPPTSNTDYCRDVEPNASGRSSAPDTLAHLEECSISNCSLPNRAITNSLITNSSSHSSSSSHLPQALVTLGTIFRDCLRDILTYFAKRDAAIHELAMQQLRQHHQNTPWLVDFVLSFSRLLVYGVVWPGMVFVIMVRGPSERE